MSTPTIRPLVPLPLSDDASAADTTTADARTALMGDVSADALRYDPWRHLTESFPYMQVETGKLRPGRMGEWTVDNRIVLSCLLYPDEARCTLAHELVHVERGPSPKDPELAAAEERIVDGVAARRLITLNELRAVMRMGKSYQMAAALHVDVTTLLTRMETLTELERTWLTEQTTETIRKIRSLASLQAGLLRERAARTI